MAMTQKEKVLKHLQRYGKISNVTAVSKYQIYRLSEYIRELRLEGHNIETDMKKNKKTGAKWGEYVYSK